MPAIKLSGDITASKTYVVTRDLIVDLNGHTMTSNKASSYLFNANGGNITLKNGNIVTKSRVGAATNNGSITIDSGVYTSSSDVAFDAIKGGKVTLNGGTIYSREGGIGAPKDHGIIEVNGGLIETSDNFAIYTNGNSGNNNNQITINGGRLIGNIKTAGYEAIGIYVANNDTLTVNGGEIIANGGTGICMRGGHVIINDGTITATGVDKNGETVVDGKVGDNGTVLTGVSAIVYHKVSGYSGFTDGMKLEVNGGTITGVDNSIQVISDEATPQVFVTGGTLTPAYQ